MFTGRAAIVVATLIIVGFVFAPGIIRLKRLNEKNGMLEERIKVLSKNNQDLRQQLYRLENDPAYIEKVARDKLGMIKKGEVMYKLPKSDAER